jgi:hypothetical protein
MNVVAYAFDGKSNALSSSVQISPVAKDFNLAHGNVRRVFIDRKSADEFELRRVKNLVHGPETREEVGFFYDCVTDAPSLDKIHDLLLNRGHVDRYERRNVTTVHYHFIPYHHMHFLRIEFSGEEDEIAI